MNNVPSTITLLLKEVKSSSVHILIRTTDIVIVQKTGPKKYDNKILAFHC